MGKLSVQNFVLKVESKRLAKAKWDLTLPLSEARKNGEVVALGNSQLMRWLCEINNKTDRDTRVISLKKRLKSVKKNPNTVENRKKVSEIYDELNSLQFQKDYILITMNTVNHYRKLVKNKVKINGCRYRRLLGTPGGVKNSTIVFINEEVYDEIWKRIENGRDQSQMILPGKLDSYRSLVCSASEPVSMPRGVAIVRDVETAFKADIIRLANSDSDDEPIMTNESGAEITLDASDGMGLMSPELAERWGAELGLDYTPSGVCIRYAFTKGMCFTFPFLEFADEVAGTRIIEDVYGNRVDLSEIDLIVTESQMKLSSSYPNTASYLESSVSNKYEFAVTKISPEYLEDSRNLN